MIVPSIDLMNGRAVQLRQGRDLVLDAGDPIALFDRFSVAGEVAVIDLDAARGCGSNADLVRRLVRRGPCRVGGGIRSYRDAVGWLDAGAARIILGTAAEPRRCRRLPRDRVIAALDARNSRVVINGWRTVTDDTVLERARALAPFVGGFLFTQVEREGMLGGIDLTPIDALADVVGSDCRITAAGGIATPEEIAALAARDIDAQVGMALYAGRFSLGEAVTAALAPSPNGRWPTVVCDENDRTLGLAWSSRTSLTRAVDERRGIYWSRARESLWIKGETSGATQDLLRVDIDCDRDAIRFSVRQRNGFCHRGTRSCWGNRFGLDTLEQLLANRRVEAPAGSGTGRLFAQPGLLNAKLREEADELAAARGSAEATHEAADLIFFALAALVREGGTLDGVVRELARRNRRLTRRPMETESPA